MGCSSPQNATVPHNIPAGHYNRVSLPSLSSCRFLISITNSTSTKSMSTSPASGRPKQSDQALRK